MYLGKETERPSSILVKGKKAKDFPRSGYEHPDWTLLQLFLKKGFIFSYSPRINNQVLEYLTDYHTDSDDKTKPEKLPAFPSNFEGCMVDLALDGQEVSGPSVDPEERQRRIAEKLNWGTVYEEVSTHLRPLKWAVEARFCMPVGLDKIYSSNPSNHFDANTQKSIVALYHTQAIKSLEGKNEWSPLILACSESRDEDGNPTKTVIWKKDEKLIAMHQSELAKMESAGIRPLSPGEVNETVKEVFRTNYNKVFTPPASPR